jgi:hypothetical protein
LVRAALQFLLQIPMETWVATQPLDRWLLFMVAVKDKTQRLLAPAVVVVVS